MKKELVCTVCPLGCHLVWEDGILSGNNCARGYTFMIDELESPKRNISSTVKIISNNHRLLPVKTSAPIAKELVKKAVRLLMDVELSAPIRLGDVVVSDIFGTGVDFIATRTIF
ncbi:MAG: DUF1667 domain-containing protein [Oscillospiraceae bacterium]|nr:DUF1667 domain-containing protein [Oscillospiraceae bacterium]